MNRKVNLAGTIVFHHMSVEKMSEHEYNECECFEKMLNQILSGISDTSYIYNLDNLCKLAKEQLQIKVNSYNAKRSKRYRFYIDDMRIIAINDNLDYDDLYNIDPLYCEIAEYYQSKLDSIFDEFNLIILKLCVMTKNVPAFILQSNFE